MCHTWPENKTIVLKEVFINTYFKNETNFRFQISEKNGNFYHHTRSKSGAWILFITFNLDLVSLYPKVKSSKLNLFFARETLVVHRHLHTRPLFFIILKNSHKDLSNEGSNFILSPLEVGH